MLMWVSPSNVYAEIQASLHFGIAAVRDFYNKKGALDLHFCKIQSAFALCHVVYSKTDLSIYFEKNSKIFLQKPEKFLIKMKKSALDK